MLSSVENEICFITSGPVITNMSDIQLYKIQATVTDQHATETTVIAQMPDRPLLLTNMLDIQLYL